MPMQLESSCYCSPLSHVQLFATPCQSFPVLHYLLGFAQTHVHWVDDTIQPSHPLSPPSSPALNLAQHKGLFQWVSSSHQVAKVLELQIQHQSFQWRFRVESGSLNNFSERNKPMMAKAPRVNECSFDQLLIT